MGLKITRCCLFQLSSNLTLGICLPVRYWMVSMSWTPLLRMMSPGKDYMVYEPDITFWLIQRFTQSRFFSISAGGTGLYPSSPMNDF